MSIIKQKILGFIGRHRLLVFSLFIAILLPIATSAAGDVKIRMISDGQKYLRNAATGKYMTANRMLGPNGEVYFCANKGLRGPDYLSRGSYGTYTSPQKMGDLPKKVLLLGYPNRQIAGFNESEQYHITQNAFWASSTNYVVNAKNTVGNLRATSYVNGKARNEQILQAVKDLYNHAVSTNIAEFNPSLTLNSAPQATLKGDIFVAGPFSVTGKNVRSANLALSATGVNNARFYNEQNQTITHIGLGQKFYISFPKLGNSLKGTANINLSGKQSYLEGLIYKPPQSNMQDMATLEVVETAANLNTAAKWELTPSGRVEILKIDAISSKPLSGATFEIYNSSGQKVYSAVTDNSGKITSSNLNAGKYTFKETVAPSGYYLNDRVGTVEIKTNGELVRASLSNQPIPDTPIQIKKVDANTKTVLRGAKIEVLNSNNVKVFSGLTDNNGIAEVGQLKAGKYTYKEVEPPAGYYHNTNTYDFTINPGDSLKVLTIENTAVKKITVCDLTSRSMVTIEETKFDSAKYSKNQDDCTSIEVCDLTTRKSTTIIKTAFDKTKHSNNWDDCTSIEVCDLTTRKPATIIKTAFDKTKHSNNWDDCTETKVCELDSKKVITIVESAFDPAKHSRNLEDCNLKIEVCELETKNIIIIDETKFDSVKHSKNLEDCIPKIEVCDLNTKQIVTIKEADFDETKYSKDHEDCLSTPAELPKTGPLETVAALIAITAVSLSITYWYKSAQAVKQIKR
jgi:hypothetical protein